MSLVRTEQNWIFARTWKTRSPTHTQTAAWIHNYTKISTECQVHFSVCLTSPATTIEGRNIFQGCAFRHTSAYTCNIARRSGSALGGRAQNGYMKIVRHLITFLHSIRSKCGFSWRIENNPPANYLSTWNALLAGYWLMTFWSWRRKKMMECL
jgi:hypothetical protein